MAWNAIGVWNSTGASAKEGSTVFIILGGKPTSGGIVQCHPGEGTHIFIELSINCDSVVPRINFAETLVRQLLPMWCKNLIPTPCLLLVLGKPSGF